MPKYHTVSDLYNDLRRTRERIFNAVEDAVHDVLNEFKTTLVTFHMQKRSDDSLGIRKGTLVRHLTAEVKRRGRSMIVGRVYFKSKKRDMIAKVHQEGATIRAKGDGLLVFRVHRKYARGVWPPEWGKSKVIAVKKVVIPPGRFPFRETWDRMLPRSNKIIDGRIEKAIRDHG